MILSMNKAQKQKLISVLTKAKADREMDKDIREMLFSLVRDKISSDAKFTSVSKELLAVMGSIQKDGVRVIDSEKAPEAIVKELGLGRKELVEIQQILSDLEIKGLKEGLESLKRANTKQTQTISEILMAWLAGLISAFSGMASRLTFKVQPTEESFTTPQMVTLYDPKTQKVVRPQDLIPPNKAINVYVPVKEVNDAIYASLDQYKVCDVDDSGTPKYYGFADKGEYWYIMRDNGSGEYRYVRGYGDYATAWTGRAGLTYDYYFNVF